MSAPRCFACDGGMPPNKVVFCLRCWFETNPKDRAQFRSLYSRNQETVAWRDKDVKMVRYLVEKGVVTEIRLDQLP